MAQAESVPTDELEFCLCHLSYLLAMNGNLCAHRCRGKLRARRADTLTPKRKPKQDAAWGCQVGG